jgi:hypothetical protein
MKYCGCNNCRLNGERNLEEEFNLYYALREEDMHAEFNAIFMNSYSVGEMEKLYSELEPEFSGVSRVVARIMSYNMGNKAWDSYEYLRDNYGNFKKEEGKWP